MVTNPAAEVLFEMEAGVAPEVSAVPVGAARTFRPYDQHQRFLLPPSLDDWLPVGHCARFISEVVDSMLDLSSVYDAYVAADGAPPYDPAMMLKLLLYGYSSGVTSSRELERRCQIDVAFRWLAANATPDYRSIARFRRRHLAALDSLFVQVLALCATAGLVKLGRVALDGTKLGASASRHKAMSYDRLGPRITEIERQVATMLAEAEAADRAEDDAYGQDARGDELPAELATREGRLAKLRQAKASLEHDARERAATDATDKAQRLGASEDEVANVAAEAASRAAPKPRSQRNFTDPEARVMKTNDGFHYAYNAQAVVDEGAQVILAAELTQRATDVGELFNMIEATTANLAAIGIDDQPRVVLVDAGYCSKDNLETAAGHDTDFLIATGRLKHHERVLAPKGRIPKDATAKQRMARRLRTKAGRTDYARRKAIVEPAFGQMKVRQHAGQLRLRGLVGAQGEWTLHALCHNLRKLANAQTATWATT